MEYIYRKSGEQAQECDCCQCEAPLAHFEGGPGLGDDQWLCEVCSATTISRICRNQAQSPAEYQHQLTCRVMAELANLLLDRLTDRTKGKP